MRSGLQLHEVYCLAAEARWSQAGHEDTHFGMKRRISGNIATAPSASHQRARRISCFGGRSQPQHPPISGTGPRRKRGGGWPRWRPLRWPTRPPPPPQSRQSYPVLTTRRGKWRRVTASFVEDAAKGTLCRAKLHLAAAKNLLYASHPSLYRPT